MAQIILYAPTQRGIYEMWYYCSADNRSFLRINSELDKEVLRDLNLFPCSFWRYHFPWLFRA